MGQVDVVELPHRVGVAAGVVGIDAFVADAALVEGAVVVDDDDGVDAVAGGGFEFGAVVPEAAIAGKGDYGTVGEGAFGAEGGGQGPAEGAGGADEVLPGVVEVDVSASPDAGVAGVGDEHCVVGEMVGEFLAEPLRANGLGVGAEVRFGFGAPFPDDLLGAVDPFGAF